MIHKKDIPNIGLSFVDNNNNMPKESYLIYQPEHEVSNIKDFLGFIDNDFLAHFLTLHQKCLMWLSFIMIIKIIHH